MTTDKARSRARRLLTRFEIAEPPVDVFGIARLLGAQIIERGFDGEISAMLYRAEGEPPVIGLNQRDTRLRRRFSVAHEIGHLIMHPGRPLIVDGFRVNYRDQKASSASYPEEVEANAFAAELLMPEEFVSRAFQAIAEDVSEGELISQLKKRFDVSSEAMRYRLINLGLMIAL